MMATSVVAMTGQSTIMSQVNVRPYSSFSRELSSSRARPLSIKRNTVAKGRAPLRVAADSSNGNYGRTLLYADSDGKANVATYGTPEYERAGQSTWTGFMDNLGYGDNATSPIGEGKLRLFAGSSNPALAKDVAMAMGMDLGKVLTKRFADGEIYVKLQESIRGCDVFIIQPTCPPVNDHLMELLVMIDACRRASARNVTAVIPYFGYARADRKTSGRESIAAKLVANLITKSGCDRVIALDLHSGQCAGYFDIPVDHIAGSAVALDYLTSRYTDASGLVVVSPDVGGVARARAFAKKLGDAPLAIVDKRRQAHNVAKVYNLIGDVEGKTCVLVDDMIDTAGTLSAGAALLKDRGAKEVIACCTHAVFSPPAIERLSNGDFEEVIITDTIPHSLATMRDFPQLTILSTANLLAETIWRVHSEAPVIKLT